MSACYYVTLRVKVTDEKSIVRVLQEMIARHGNDGRTNFSLDRHAEEGCGTDTMDDLMRIFLAGWKCNQFTKTVNDGGFTVYDNGFNASYGWETVMQDMFEAIIPYVSEDSTIDIEPDCEGYRLGIKDGKPVTVKDWNIDDEDYGEDD